jgi:cobalt/nickel transport system permease protein
MSKIGSHFLDIGYMDTLASGDSPLHRLDPRVKLITTLAFIVTVVSFDKHTLSKLIPFFIFPIFQISIGGLPTGYLLRKVLIISPFAVLIAIFNPLMDREILYRIGTVGVSGGWVSFFSILTRFLLTVTAALVLIAATGFNTVCTALARLGVPRPFVVQLMFLYRYIFVLTEEASRMVRAVSLRSFGSGGMGFKTFVSLLGHLLLRTLDRAQRIHLAMLSRGFDGRICIVRSMKIGHNEIAFAVGWFVLFVTMRYFNITEMLGTLVTGFFV